ENVVSLMRRAVTSTGLTTTVNVIRRAYETGRNATEAMKQDLEILFDDLLPNWNYTAVPEMRQ
ncbi:MAG: ISAzo13 family transposase, partial [Fuerstiella sp.]